MTCVAWLDKRQPEIRLRSQAKREQVPLLLRLCMRRNEITLFFLFKQEIYNVSASINRTLNSVHL